MSQEREEELSFDKVCSGDKPSLYALGLAVSAMLRGAKHAVVMVDALGRVVLMPEDSISVLRTPRLSDEELHAYPQEAALQLLILQGDTEDQIVEYLGRRKEAER